MQKGPQLVIVGLRELCASVVYLDIADAALLPIRVTTPCRHLGQRLSHIVMDSLHQPQSTDFRRDCKQYFLIMLIDFIYYIQKLMAIKELDSTSIWKMPWEAR